jgi:hypothetical protein
MTTQHKKSVTSHFSAGGLKSQDLGAWQKTQKKVRADREWKGRKVELCLLSFVFDVILCVCVCMCAEKKGAKRVI